MAKKAAKKRARKAKVEPASRGLTVSEMGAGDRPEEVTTLVGHIEADGGAILAAYPDPLAGHWLVLAALPLERVEPTPFQRDLSATHAKRMTEVIEKLDRYLDPVLAVRTEEGRYWVPNGLHRLTAMANLGARSIVALVSVEFELVYKILALNTEKAHNLKEKSLEVIRMARALSELDSEPETAYEVEFDEPALLTLGLCYEKKARFSGSAYHPITKRAEQFLEAPLAETLSRRAIWADALLEVDAAVAAAVKALQERGMDSPYLKNFVVARINPIRGRGKAPEMDDLLAKMKTKAEGFDPEAIKPEQIRASGGA